MGLVWGPVYAMGAITIACVLVGFMMPAGEINYFIARIFIYGVPIYLFYRVPEWLESEKELERSSLKKVSGSFRR